MHPYAFPSGERGPRGAVNEESTVCIARTTSVQKMIKKILTIISGNDKMKKQKFLISTRPSGGILRYIG